MLENLKSDFYEGSSRIFLLWLALLFIAVLAFHGKPVPYSNEFIYLLRLQPNFLAHDWTFSVPASEHWLFNLVFSFPAAIFSLETLGWAGRIGCWALSLIAMIKIGKLWEISYWKIALAIFLWLAIAQSYLNREWIFGGFEAKVVAYVCLLYSLIGFSKRKILLPSILLGLTFSFHPAVGLWAIPAVGLAMLFERIPAIDLGKIVVITFLFSLFGALPLLADQTGVAASFDDWKYVVIYGMPWHLDAFQFSKSGTLLVFIMLGFNCVALWKSENFALRFLLKFQIALGLFFLLGIALRLFEMFPLLRLMPMRLLPVFTPLFFIFTAFFFVSRLASKQQRVIVSLFAVLTVAAFNPFGLGYSQIRQTVAAWASRSDDLQEAALWIAENVPPEAVVIQPPHRRDLWYFSKRAIVASVIYPTYDRLPEWRERIADLTGNSQGNKGATATAEIEIAYNQLSTDRISQLKTKYAATFLVSRAIYPYPIVFESETYKVYRLP